MATFSFTLLPNGTYEVSKFIASDSTSVEIPSIYNGKAVTSIGADAFRDCRNLTGIVIPDNITSIGKNAFLFCKGLTNITVSKGNLKYHSAENCLIETESKTLILGCQTSVIPTDGSVTSIDKEAFYYCDSLTNITIPNDITSIGDWAFAHCSSLTSVVIPNSGTSIGKEAFAHCYNLTSVTISNGVTSIGEAMFAFCSSLTSITIPDSVTSIGYEAFYNCGVTDIYFTGTEEEWNEIAIGNHNEKLLNATIHYIRIVTTDSVKVKIQGLIDTANAITGQNDTTLTDAVNHLKEGYGQSSDSYYDTFWDSYQWNGNRDDYGSAFAGQGWNNETLKPKYNIAPTNAYMILRNCNFEGDLVEHFEKLGVSFDLSKATITLYLFAYSTKITRVGIIDVRGSTSSIPLDSAFQQCKNLVTIEKIYLKTGSTAEFNKASFSDCVSLENVLMEGEITNNGLDLHWSTKLSKASIESVINALSPNTNGLTVTLSQKAVDKAFISDNIFQVIPNTNTSGSTITNTIYTTKEEAGVVAGIAEIEGGKDYVLARNIAGKPWRYFFYDTYPLDTGAQSIGGAYESASGDCVIFTAPSNATYLVARAGEQLTEQEMQDFSVVCGLTSDANQEWQALIASKSNWTIDLV